VTAAGIEKGSARPLDFDGFAVRVLAARIRATEPSRHRAVGARRGEGRAWLAAAAGEAVARFDLRDPRWSGARVTPDAPAGRGARAWARPAERGAARPPRASVATPKTGH
jgi:hypothetical protein